MRRDQIHKLCLNFFLTSENEFKRKDDQSWTFGANDFSDGEYEPTSFAIRFKNKEIAEAFRKAIDAAVVGGDAPPEINGTSPTPTNPNAELLKRLMLPDNFFDYSTAPECAGCLGCKDEDKFVFKSDNKSEGTDVDSKPISLHMPNAIVKTKARRTSQDKRVSFKIAEKKENEKLTELLADKASPEEKPTNLSKSEGTSNIFAKFNSENPSPVTSSIFGSVFGNSNNSSSIFSSSANTAPVTNANQSFGTGPSIFGSGSSSFSFGSVTSTTPATATSTTNIFGGKILSLLSLNFLLKNLF